MNKITLPPLTEITRKGGLYIIYLSDKHYYGGRAVNFRARWRRHLTALEKNAHGNPYLQAVFNKHHRFDPEIIEIIDTLPEMISAEGLWLQKHFGRPGCLNLSMEPTNNTYVSPEARQKISAANRGRKMSPEAISRSVESRKGIKASAEHRMKNSLSHLGKHPTKATRQKMSESSFCKGKPISEKLRSAIVQSNQRRAGAHQSSETKAHLSAYVSNLIWVHQGLVCRRVHQLELDKMLQQGWERGRKPH
jgi:hypothetical protein